MRYYIYFSNGCVIEQDAELPEPDFVATHRRDTTVAKIMRKSDGKVVYEKPSN